MKIQMLILALVASFSMAHAADETRLENRTSDGQRQVISTGSCSFPAKSAYMQGQMESKGSYSVCQEKITTQYKVSGSGWNSSYEPVPGTSQKSYQIETKTITGIGNFTEGDAASEALATLSATTSCGDQLSNLRALTVHVSQTPCGQ
jgi:hypothetical protein